MYFIKSDNENIDAVLYDRQGLTLLPGGATIAAGSRGFRVGDMVSRNTTTKRILVAKYSQVAAAAAVTTQAVQVDDAHAFEVGDVIHPRNHGTSTDQAARTITAINYSTNVITVSENWASALVVNDSIGNRSNQQHRPIGVALLPEMDKDAALLGFGAAAVAPKLGDVLYGTVAITGRFKYNKLRNFETTNDHTFHGDLAGTYVADLNAENGLYIVDQVSSVLAL